MMNHWWKTILIGLCLLLTPLTQAHAFTKTVELPEIGQISVPEELEMTPLTLPFNKLPATSNAATTEQEKKMLKGLEKLDFHVYQLAVRQEDRYHTGFLVIMQDKDLLPPGSKQYFGAPISAEQRGAIEKMHTTAVQSLDKFNAGLAAALKEAAAKQAKDPKQKATNEPLPEVTCEVLALTPLEFPLLANQQGYGAGARLLVSVEKIKFPFYAQGYVFAPKQHLSVIFFVSNDAENPFWMPLFTDAMNSIQAL